MPHQIGVLDFPVDGNKLISALQTSSEASYQFHTLTEEQLGTLCNAGLVSMAGGIPSWVLPQASVAIYLHQRFQKAEKRADKLRKNLGAHVNNQNRTDF